MQTATVEISAEAAWSEQAREMGVPLGVAEALAAYVHRHIEPGSFTLSVLTNDLAGAVLRADPFSRAALLDIVRVVANDVPSEAQGSPEAVRAWLAKGA